MLSHTMGALRVSFASEDAFLQAFDTQVVKGGLFVPGAAVAAGLAPGSACALELDVPSHPALELQAQLAAAIPGVGVAVTFPAVPDALVALARQLRGSPGGAAPGTPPSSAPGAAMTPTGPVAGSSPGADPGGAETATDVPGEDGASDDAERASEPPTAEDARARASLFERLRVLSIAEKMHLALSGSRDERMALMRDGAKPVHLFVLKNPRLGLDEVQYAAKLATLSPDALKYIADHRDWGQNPGVCAALVRNHRVPVPTAIRLLDRIALSELRAIAKGGARDQIVQAAKKRLGAEQRSR